MNVEIKVPSMGESILEATVGALIKQNGDFVAVDEELLELETDKVNQVLYAPSAGVVTWKVSVDDVVKVGQVIGYVDSSKTAPTPTPPAAEAAGYPTQLIQPPKTQEPVEEVTLVDAASLLQQTPQPQTGGARKGKDQFLQGLAEEQQPPSAPAAAHVSPARPAVPPAAGRETRKKMSKIRKVIAARLVEVQQQTAMLTTFNEADMSSVMALREQYKEAFAKQHNARLGFMSFFVKACVVAMKAIPEVNAYIDGDDIVYRNYFDIGIAVGTDRGVMVPVVRECDKLSFAGIEQAIEQHAKRAREGGLTTSDFQGGGFTITNGGVYGSLLSTPIINPPQSAILGMHKIMKRPVVVDDQIVIRPMMYLALSYDHRLIDGKEAVSFLVHIKNSLEDPSRLLLDII